MLGLRKSFLALYYSLLWPHLFPLTVLILIFLFYCLDETTSCSLTLIFCPLLAWYAMYLLNLLQYILAPTLSNSFTIKALQNKPQLILKRALTCPKLGTAQPQLIFLLKSKTLKLSILESQSNKCINPYPSILQALYYISDCLPLIVLSFAKLKV